MKVTSRKKGLEGSKVIRISRAEHVKDYRIRIRFDDGATRIVDFGPFLRSAKNPTIREFLDIEKFRSFEVRDGDLMWGDFELCFPIADLYEGKL